METRKVSNKPAFPNENTISCKRPDCFGISKRFYAACAAMQGLIASTDSEDSFPNPKDIAERSFEFADELLKQENI